jgi:hypothetical protein
MKAVQGAFSLQKRTSNTSNIEITSLFLFFGEILALFDPDPNVDPDLAEHCQWGYGSTTLHLAFNLYGYKFAKNYL